MYKKYTHIVPSQKFLFLFVTVFLIFITGKGYSQCINADFSMGDFTNWTGSTGLNSGGNYSSEVAGLNIGNSNSLPMDPGQQTIMTMPATDPNTGGALNVIPPNGAYSCRLGNENVNYGAEKLKYTLNVTSSNAIFSYQYAVVLEDPAHPTGDQPKFTIYIKDVGGNIIDSTCGMYEVSAQAGITGFQDATHAADGETTRWKNWTTVGVDLSSYIGQNVTIEFTTYDCAQGAHFGYAYISCFCGALELTQQCFGSSVVVSAPPGFASYAWSTGQSTQTVTYNNPVNGDTITCTCTSVQGCGFTLQAILNTGPAINLGNDTIICTAGIQQLDAGPGYNSYQWSTGETTQQINVTSSGTYSVTASQGDGGCWSTDTISIGINLLPGFDLGEDTGYCSGSAAVISAGNFFDAYQWSTGETTSQISIDSAGMYYVTVTSNLCSGTATDSIFVSEEFPPLAEAGTADTICLGGCTNLTASGGSGYHWSTGSNSQTISVCPNTSRYYTVTVYNTYGCSAIDSVLVYLHGFSASVSHTNAGCNSSNGSATVNVTGGSGSFSYLWNTVPPQTTQTAVNLPTGTYSVTVTDLLYNCTNSYSVTVSSTNSPNVSTQYITPATCGMNNGSVSINCSGGTQPYSFVWSSTPTQTTQTLVNVPPGYYCVTVTDANSCSVTNCATVSLDPYSTPSICMVSVDTASNHCLIIWEKPATNGIDKYYIYRESSISGIYNLIATQNYNDYSIYTDTASNSLQQPHRYELAIFDTCGTLSQQSNYHQTLHLTVNAGNGGSWNLLWNDYIGFSFNTYNIYRGTSNSNMSLLNSVASSVTSYTDLTPPPGDVYYMIEVVKPTACNPSLKSGNSYTSTISNIAITSGTGINYFSDDENIQVFPNPNNGVFTIQMNAAASLEILNSLGQIIYKGSMYTAKDIDLSQLSKGMYILKLQTEKGSYFRKIMIE